MNQKPIEALRAFFPERYQSVELGSAHETEKIVR
jgi:hypothetical protein